MIFVLKGCADYPANTYYLEKYKTRFEAIESIKESGCMITDYIFIEGKELKLTLTEVENER